MEIWFSADILMTSKRAEPIVFTNGINPLSIDPLIGEEFRRLGTLPLSDCSQNFFGG
jgi:hypothetical protein